MRATVAPGSLRVPAKKPPVLSGVARMSEATSGKNCPAYRCAHAGYGCAGVVASASEETLRVERCSPDERRRYPGKTAPHIAALMRATVAPGSLRAQAKKRPVKRCSPDERRRYPGKTNPAYRCAHAGYGCAGGVAGAREEALRVDRCSPDERSDIRGKTAPHIAALMRATVAPGSLHPPAKKPSVLTGVARMSEATSGERLPRISLRSCGLRLLSPQSPPTSCVTPPSGPAIVQRWSVITPNALPSQIISSL